MKKSYLAVFILSALVMLTITPRIQAGEVTVTTMELDSQVLILATGALMEAGPGDSLTVLDGDVRLAYNADRTPHVVVMSVAEEVTLVFVDEVAFDAITAADIAQLTFTPAGVDLPLESHDTVVVRTADGLHYKLGNAIESGMSVTLNYAPLQ